PEAALRRHPAGARLAVLSPARPQGKRRAVAAPGSALALVPTARSVDRPRTARSRLAQASRRANARGARARGPVRDRLQRPRPFRRPPLRPARGAGLRSARCGRFARNANARLLVQSGQKCVRDTLARTPIHLTHDRARNPCSFGRELARLRDCAPDAGRHLVERARTVEGFGLDQRLVVLSTDVLQGGALTRWSALV